MNARKDTYRPDGDIIQKGHELGECIVCRQSFFIGRGYYVLRNNQITCKFERCRISGSEKIKPTNAEVETTKKKLQSLGVENFAKLS